MNSEEKLNYWLELAEDDFITAEIVLKSKRLLHFGFLSHLVVEKLIKSYFWKNLNQEPPYNHNLLSLAKKSELYNILNESQIKLLYKLMPLNIEARYPTSKQEIYKTLSEEYCIQIFEETKEFLEWMRKLLTK